MEPQGALAPQRIQTCYMKFLECTNHQTNFFTIQSSIN
ncbi:hypothetical protein TREPR_2167 [Treponema primitia ZAS-2]|uniref:Uncharacterized protein n=1 Tax=Treponema primitia (strain ATCC BAA-887 / DSM 12427 / ZAS-2) TaxID=545694 RepID=F5YJ35_TREPZ|nr:hypothetical protein TREPR_2167 [Treponema primitia ZAS-2]